MINYLYYLAKYFKPKKAEAKHEISVKEVTFVINVLYYSLLLKLLVKQLKKPVHQRQCNRKVIKLSSPT